MNGVYLQHHGVKGMKWGVRKKYYNKDGSLNTAGKQKELKDTYKAERKAATSRAERKAAKSKYEKAVENTYNKNYNELDRAVDKHNLGAKAVNRINDKMNAGQSYTKAASVETAKMMTKGFAITTAMMAAPVIAGAAMNSFKKYANTRSIQRANAGLQRIGTFQYEKIWGTDNLYREVMK